MVHALLVSRRSERSLSVHCKFCPMWSTPNGCAEPTVALMKATDFLERSRAHLCTRSDREHLCGTRAQAAERAPARHTPLQVFPERCCGQVLSTVIDEPSLGEVQATIRGRL